MIGVKICFHLFRVDLKLSIRFQAKGKLTIQHVIVLRAYLIKERGHFLYYPWTVSFCNHLHAYLKNTPDFQVWMATFLAGVSGLTAV